MRCNSCVLLLVSTCRLHEDLRRVSTILLRDAVCDLNYEFSRAATANTGTLCIVTTLFNNNEGQTHRFVAQHDTTPILAQPGTAYRGNLWHNERTVSVTTLGETKFARCDVHSVRVHTFLLMFRMPDI